MEAGKRQVALEHHGKRQRTNKTRNPKPRDLRIAKAGHPASR